MLLLGNKEVFQGMSRKQIDDRGGHAILTQAVEKLTPQPIKNQFGFNFEARVKLV